MTKVTVPVLEHQQTGKVHILQLELMGLRHCYCSFNREREPEMREIDLTEDKVCDTCVKGFLDDEPENTAEEFTTEADFAQLRDSVIE